MYAKLSALVFPLALLTACGDSSSGSGDTGTTASGTGGGTGAGAGSGGSAGAACEIDKSYAPEIVPADFSTTIDNPLYALVPGTKFTYKEGADTIEIVVSADTKTIMGVECVVVRDTHSDANHEVVEDTFDWFAQDKDGNVWYFGEDTKEYEGGKVTSTEGSWTGGVDGALPGIVMHAMNAPGAPYRQEYLACEAEDQAEVLATDATATVPFGSYTNCVKTHDFTRLDPGLNEEKYYCAGVGLVVSVDKVTGDREELVDIQKP